ncbi:hypothetical protein GOBAR_DD15221 [Gossypium barbadense]|nr:hypothetical protein GOBAR_DD15221 [Gossypium barbadense]
MRAVKNENIPSPFAAEALACLQPLKVGGGSGVEGGDGGGSAHCLATEDFRREAGWGLDQDTLELFVARENRNSFTYSGEEDV